MEDRLDWLWYCSVFSSRLSGSCLTTAPNEPLGPNFLLCTSAWLPVCPGCWFFTMTMGSRVVEMLRFMAGAAATIELVRIILPRAEEKEGLSDTESPLDLEKMQVNLSV